MPISRRKLFLPSAEASLSMVERRAAMSPAARTALDRVAVTRCIASAKAKRVAAQHKTQRYIQSQRSRKSNSVLDWSRRTLMAASVALLATTAAAYADTAFTSFAFPGTGFPTNRTMPARIADIFNVLDFGADPTGVSDSQPGVQRAVNGTGGASGNGIIFFPKGAYSVLSGVLVPISSNLQFIGEGNGSSVTGNFNGFIFDNLSDPVNENCTGVFEGLSIQNNFIGNRFSMATGGTWSASGSPTSILLSGANPGVVAGGALWVTGIGTNSVFIGMITSVASWPTVTVSSTAVAHAADASFTGSGSGTNLTVTAVSGTINIGATIAGTGVPVGTTIASQTSGTPGGAGVYVTSGATTSSSASLTSFANLTAQIVQCYPAGASWSSSASTITMAATRPAGIGTGVYYVYNYENYLADPRYDFPIGTATWSGTTVTFVPGYGGAIQGSTGSADRLWFAPAAGCIRASSMVGASVRNCNLSGFFGVTTSQDKIVPNGGGVGAAEGFHVVVDTCNFGNPSGFSGLLGQTGIYFQNNSISINANHNSEWCSERLSGTACGIIGGRCEVGYFGIILGGDFTASNNSLSAGFIKGRSGESNLQFIYCKGGSASITDTGASSNALVSTSLGGIYLNAFSGTVQNVGIIGNFGTSFGIYIADPGGNRGQITFISVSSVNSSTAANDWRIPTQAWWGTCISSNNVVNHPLEYAFSGLPTGSGSPAPFEGETYDISDCNTSTFLATAAAGGSGATAHRRVRWNNTSSLWQVIG